MLRTALLGCALSIGVVSAAPAATLYFEAMMKGASEVPPTNSEGTGKAIASLDTVSKSFSYRVTWDKLNGPATAAHFHGPAAPGKNAGVVVPIDGKNPTSPAFGSATLTDPQIKDLEAGVFNQFRPRGDLSRVAGRRRHAFSVGRTRLVRPRHGAIGRIGSATQGEALAGPLQALLGRRC